VSVPFNLACGTCRNCTAGWTSACLRANPSGQPGAGYGYPQMGPYRGGQAEYLRVPWADFNLLELPPGDEHGRDFTLLSDIFPTGYHGTELAGVEPGRTVAIFGAGPVGLMAAHSANIRGAAQTFVVDFQSDRLALAATMGATPVNLAETDATEAIMDATDGFGVDRPGPPRSSPTSCPWTGQATPTSSSTTAPRAGPRSSSTRARAPDPHPDARSRWRRYSCCRVWLLV
jgi:glutathione-independent formaldehyde dehydrogenase